MPMGKWFAIWVRVEPGRTSRGSTRPQDETFQSRVQGLGGRERAGSWGPAMGGHMDMRKRDERVRVQR